MMMIIPVSEASCLRSAMISAAEAASRPLVGSSVPESNSNDNNGTVNKVYALRVCNELVCAMFDPGGGAGGSETDKK